MNRKRRPIKKIFAIFVEGAKGGSEDLYFSELNRQQWVCDSSYKLKIIPCGGVNKLLDKAFKGEHEGHCHKAIENVGQRNIPNFDKVCTSVGKVIQEIV